MLSLSVSCIQQQNAFQQVLPHQGHPRQGPEAEPVSIGIRRSRARGKSYALQDKRTDASSLSLCHHQTAPFPNGSGESRRAVGTTSKPEADIVSCSRNSVFARRPRSSTTVSSKWIAWSSIGLCTHTQIITAKRRHWRRTKLNL